MGLSKAMVGALYSMKANHGWLPGSYPMSFQTGEALRRRGFAGRLSETISRTVYVTEDSEIDQHDGPRERHAWTITAAGRKAIT